MKPWLFVGAKVVCINDCPGRMGNFDAPKLSLTAVYTIGEIADSLGILHVGLDEIARCPTGERWMYGADRFRPVTNTDAQVEAMRKLMQKARDEKRVTVSA